MGNSAAKGDNRGPPAPAGTLVASGADAAFFTVEPLRRPPGVPPVLLLRIDKEALSVVDPDSRQVLRSWPFHTILCWGYTGSTFQFKTIHSGVPTAAAVGPAAPAKVSSKWRDTAMDAAITDARAPSSSSSSLSTTCAAPASPAAAATTALESVGVYKQATSAAVDAALSHDEGARAPYSVIPTLSTSGPLDDQGRPLPADAEVAAATAAASAAHEAAEADAAAAGRVETFVVVTVEGFDIEAAVMSSVRQLMGQMDLRGVGDDEFGALLATLDSLAGEGADGEAAALVTVRQMALQRSFDARQAAQLVTAVGAISPFEQIDAAVILYSSLLHKASFPLVLSSFSDAADRDNVCHRLGIRVDEAGNVIAVTTRAQAAGAGPA